MRRFALLVLPAIAAPLFAQGPAAAPAHPMAGEWVGRLNAGALSLRLGFSVRALPDGSLEGDLDSYDQNVLNIRADSVRASGDTLRLWLGRVAVRYQGVVAADGRTMRGTWTQGGAPLPLDLAKADSAALAAFLPSRPQTPKAPFPYRAEEVSLLGGASGVTLAGTLTVPDGPGPHPAVILVSGSGPQDRDESLLGHKPFHVLADHLSRRGIAVLRYDERGVGKSTGSFVRATSRDFADDARAALTWLRARPGIAGDRVGVIGHSEGGMIAPMIARDPAAGVAFIVLLAGPGVPGDSILLAQGRLIGRSAGLPDSLLAKSTGVSRRIYADLRASRDTTGLRDRIRALYAAYGASLTPDEKRAVQWSDAAIDAQVAQLMSPWFRWFLTHDPRASLREVRVPVLALNGTLDLQVPHEDNLRAIEEAVRAGGNRDVEVVAYPGLNHLFQTAKTGAVAEYSAIDETMAPAVLDKIADWIALKTGLRVRKGG